MKVLRSMLLILAVLLLGINRTQAVDLIVDGSFEDLDIRDFWSGRTPASGDLLSSPTGYWAQLQAGNTELPGWIVTQGNIDVVRNEWPAFDGAQSIDLVGFVLGGLKQTFATMPGSLYHLSFEYANNPSNGGGTAQIDLTGQSTLFSDTIAHYSSGGPYNMDWLNYSADFVADSNATTLLFKALTQSNSGGILIDGVSVVAIVPEPAPIVLALACLVFFGMHYQLVRCPQRLLFCRSNASYGRPFDRCSGSD